MTDASRQDTEFDEVSPEVRAVYRRRARWLCLAGALVAVGLVLKRAEVERDDRKSFVPEATRPAAPPPEPALPIADVEAARAALVSADYAALEQRLVWNLDSARADHGYEHRYRTAFDAFDDQDPALSDPLDQWVARSPESSVARLARADHYSAMGWAARGTRWASKTSDDQFRTMHQWFDLAKADLAAARRIDSTNILVYWLALGLGPSGNDDMRASLDDGLRQLPGSLLLHTRYQYFLRPRWNGGHDYGPIHDMVQFANEADRAAALNPRLLLVRGLVAYDSAEALSGNGERAAAIEMYGRALRFGDYWMFRLGRANEHFDASEWQQAKADYDAVLAERPTDVESRAKRALSCYALARLLPAGAERDTLMHCVGDDLRIALELDPLDVDLKWVLKRNPILTRFVNEPQ